MAHWPDEEDHTSAHVPSGDLADTGGEEGRVLIREKRTMPGNQQQLSRL